MKDNNSLIPAERIERAILLIRGQKVLLDRDFVLPHINTMTYRGRRGSRSARREEGEYSIVFDRRATQQTGMHRRPNATVFM
jgi:hypothetical protein